MSVFERVLSTRGNFEDLVRKSERHDFDVNLFTFEAMRERMRFLLEESDKNGFPQARSRIYTAEHLGLPYREAVTELLVHDIPVALCTHYFPQATPGERVRWKDIWQPVLTLGLYGSLFETYLLGVNVTRYVRSGCEPIDVYSVTDSYVGLRNSRQVVGGTGWSQVFQQYAAESLGICSD